MRTRASRAALTALAVITLATGCVAGADADPGPSASPTAEVPAPVRIPGIVTNEDVVLAEDALVKWADETSAEPVEIQSSVDGTVQDALWAPPASDDAPLLVHVHSWSANYRQQIGVPIAEWAGSVGWGFIQPDFRGVNDKPAATGSGLTTQDVIDAVDFAIAEGGVDPERVYITGFSGGGMMSLLAAGRFGDRFAGAAAWVPVYDLVSWYAYNRDVVPEREYQAQLEQSCSGDPTSSEDARADCVARSPSTVMTDIRAAGTPIYLAGGMDDTVVPVVDVLRAFNALADEPDRIPDDVLSSVAVGALPSSLVGDDTADTRFTSDDPDVLFSRSSASVTAVVFDGGHEFVFYPGLDWLARLDASRN